MTGKTRSIFDVISETSIEMNVVQRKRPEKYILIDKNYDVKITETTQGANKYPCVKITFSNHPIVKDGGFLNVYCLNECVFFKVSNTGNLNSRCLSFEKTGRKNNVTCGSFAAKLTCEENEIELLRSFAGKHKLHIKHDMHGNNTEYYYIKRPLRTAILKRSKKNNLI